MPRADAAATSSSHHVLPPQTGPDLRATVHRQMWLCVGASASNRRILGSRVEVLEPRGGRRQSFVGGIPVALSTGADLVGRDAALSVIADWLAEAEGGEYPGREKVLSLEGDPGIGKTTLWAEAVRRAGRRNWTVLGCRPRPSDVGLSHLGLTDLLRPVTDDEIGELPRPQGRALLIATLREEPGPEALDPLAVGIGLAALISAQAARGPLLLAVDDLQWLDRASARALAFALSCVGTRRCSLPGHRPPRRSSQGLGGAGSDGLNLGREQWRRTQIGPLSVAALHRVLVSTLGQPIARPLLVRITRQLREIRSTPWRSLGSSSEWVSPPGRPLPVPPDQRDMALLRMRRLPLATRNVLAQVAVMSRPSTDALDVAALAPAERAGMVHVLPNGLVDFTHPLFGSALYASLPEASRRAIHREVAARSSDAEERAWHLALAASGPDEEIAAALDRAAETAGTRGAAETVVELKQLALQLTPNDDVAALMRRQTGTGRSSVLRG